MSYVGSCTNTFWSGETRIVDGTCDSIFGAKCKNGLHLFSISFKQTPKQGCWMIVLTLNDLAYVDLMMIATWIVAVWEHLSLLSLSYISVHFLWRVTFVEDGDSMIVLEKDNTKLYVMGMCLIHTWATYRGCLICYMVKHHEECGLFLDCLSSFWAVALMKQKGPYVPVFVRFLKCLWVP